MTDMTLEELAELERLTADATPAPWCTHPNGTSVWSGSEYDSNAMAINDHLLNASSVRLDERFGVNNVALTVEARNALPALLAMARELVRLKSALEFLDKDAFACFSYLDPRKPAPHALDETEHGDNFTATAFLALATELGWPDPLQPSERKGEG